MSGAAERKQELSSGLAPVDAWVGTNLGILKGVESIKGSTLLAHLTNTSNPTHANALGVSFKGEVTNFYSANRRMEDADKSQSVSAMCWEHECREGMLYCALRNGVVQQFSAQERVFQSECDFTGGGPEVGQMLGLGKHEE